MTVRRGILWALLGIGLVLLGLLIWFALSARAAVDEMTAARDSLVAARDAVGDSQPAQAKTFITAASESAEAASNRVNGPLWDVAAAVPGLGQTPRAAQAIATSLDQALTALRPLTDQLDVLDPSALISDNGQIDIAALETAVPAMKQAQPGLDAAVATMADAPTGGLMLPQVSSAATEFTDQLDSLQSSLSTAVQFGEIAGPLLGADSEKRYFVGILNPNEARGTGGFLGNYAILSAKDGKTQRRSGGKQHRPAEPRRVAARPRQGLRQALRRRPDPHRQHEPVPALPEHREDLARVVEEEDR